MEGEGGEDEMEEVVGGGYEVKGKREGGEVGVKMERDREKWKNGVDGGKERRVEE